MRDNLQALIDGLVELRERVAGNEGRPSAEAICQVLADLQALAEDVQAVGAAAFAGIGGQSMQAPAAGLTSVPAGIHDLPDAPQTPSLVPDDDDRAPLPVDETQETSPASVDE